MKQMASVPLSRRKRSLAGLALAATLTSGFAGTGPAHAEIVKLSNGIDIFVREAGQGPRTMILLHGWSFSSAIYERILANPPAGFRVIAYDLRGFGQSSKPDQGYTYAEHLDDLAGLLDARRIDRAVLAGHSLGAFFIQDFAAANPSKVEALILTSPQPRTIKLDFVEPLRKAVEAASGENRKTFFETNTPRYFAAGALSPADTARFVDVNMQASPVALGESLSYAFQAPALPTTTFKERPVPTLVVLGSSDIVPLSVVGRIAADMPGSCVAVIARAGHSAPWEQAQAWTSTVTEFLAGPVPRSCP